MSGNQVSFSSPLAPELVPSELVLSGVIYGEQPALFGGVCKEERSGEEAPQTHGAPLALHAAETKSMGMTRPPKPPEDGGGQRTCPSRQTPPGGQTPGPAAQDHPPPASVQPAS